MWGLALFLNFLGLALFLGLDAAHVLCELKCHRFQFSFLVLELGYLPGLPTVVPILDPVIPVIEIVPGNVEEFPEDLFEILVVRCFREPKPTNIRQIRDELLWESLAEFLQRDL